MDFKSSCFENVAFRSATLLKRVPTQIFFCKYYEIFNSLFYRTPPVAASEILDAMSSYFLKVMREEDGPFLGL